MSPVVVDLNHIVRSRHPVCLKECIKHIRERNKLVAHKGTLSVNDVGVLTQVSSLELYMCIHMTEVSSAVTKSFNNKNIILYHNRCILTTPPLENKRRIEMPVSNTN